MFKRAVFGTIVTVVAFGFTMGSVFADTLDDVRKRGTVRIGVKADYKPWGFRDPSGNIIGMEIDLAQDVADRLGVELETVPVVGSNRMQFLQQGKIDIIIATMGIGGLTENQVNICCIGISTWVGNPVFTGVVDFTVVTQHKVIAFVDGDGVAFITTQDNIVACTCRNSVAAAITVFSGFDQSNMHWLIAEC